MTKEEMARFFNDTQAHVKIILTCAVSFPIWWDMSKEEFSGILPLEARMKRFENTNINIITLLSSALDKAILEVLWSHVQREPI